MAVIGKDYSIDEHKTLTFTDLNVRFLNKCNEEDKKAILNRFSKQLLGGKSSYKPPKSKSNLKRDSQCKSYEFLDGALEESRRLFKVVLEQYNLSKKALEEEKPQYIQEIEKYLVELDDEGIIEEETEISWDDINF